MAAVNTVPAMVARGIVRSGSRTRPAGTVADSTPSIANSAIVDAASNPCSESGVAGGWRT